MPLPCSTDNYKPSPSQRAFRILVLGRDKDGLNSLTMPTHVSCLKNYIEGSSLVVQWLGFGAFTAVARVQSLVRELRSCKQHSAAKKKKTKKNYIGDYK